MEIPFHRWHSAIKERRSRRHYQEQNLAIDLVRKIEDLCKHYRPYPEVRAVLVQQSPDSVFKGAVGHYGKIKNAPAYIAFIGDKEGAFVQEKIGYLGEGIILEATSLGLATCWVAGFFRPEVAAIQTGTLDHEKVWAVTPVGYAAENLTFEEKVMAGFGRHNQRKPLAELCTGIKETQWPKWIRTAVEAARLAPSAVNRQPWRFHINSDSITVGVDSLKDSYNLSKRLDCGIAMMHVEVAAKDCGAEGQWQFLIPPEVARYQHKGLNQTTGKSL